ncbi:hypothetical protein GVN21_08585 [Caulobacter sp. SLTY]|uniref:hypothetical protein n=1 Tax=Caulobacter sp. SLTY TaxID=2683262 RepID=UPI001412829B|nr:hypothetical protein [Caulobacter sp. SLTY]NBB15411.1 hypothetical protein [Caulobacter sp. SLTY]
MSADHPFLNPDAFERLREQMATAAALCTDDQLLILADSLHDARRRRREHRHNEERSWRPAESAMAGTI